MKDIEVREEEEEEEESDGTATDQGALQDVNLDRHQWTGTQQVLRGGGQHISQFTHTHTHNCKTHEVKIFDDRTMKSCQ